MMELTNEATPVRELQTSNSSEALSSRIEKPQESRQIYSRSIVWEGIEEVEHRAYPPNCYMGLGVNAVELDRKLDTIINGVGTKIDQMFLYLSPQNANAWLRETALENFKAAVTIPVEQVVEGITRRLEKTMPEHAALEIISLGSGEAKQEQRIIQGLMQNRAAEAIRIFLIDSSYPLLDIGLVDSREVLRPYSPQVEVYAMNQDFYSLPQNRPFLEALHASNRVRLVTMLGQTFANLDEETLFLRDSLGCFAPDTLLLLDICPPFAPANEPEQIKLKDPQLGGRSPWADSAEHFWAVPFMMHHPRVKDLKDIKFTRVLDSHTSRVEGSYSIEVKATIGTQEFTIRRFTRHHIQGIIKAFERERWFHINSYSFNENKRMAVLFQKR